MGRNFPSGGPRMLRFGAFVLVFAACSGQQPAPSAAPANDATATVDVGGIDGAPGDSAATPDGGAAGAAADVAPPKDVKLLARVYRIDPVRDGGKRIEVLLPPPTTVDGTLIGPFVEVRNCVREDGGVPLKFQGFQVGRLGLEKQTVLPGPDGSYLHVDPPVDASTPGDGFAELMMYWHVHRAHAWFADVFGLKDLDFPMQALVNVEFYVEPTIAGLVGMKAGWNGFPNAAFVPKEGFAQLALPPRDKGAIVFGQTEKTDFSADATVIYHEYTHAMIGTTRLSGALGDAYGLDHMPGAMNEGFADYFAASLTDQPIIGEYGIGSFAGAHMVRDLSKPRRCPDDLTTEIHADGKIVGSALWAVRKALGGEMADGIVLRALQAFTKSTSLLGAWKLIVAEAKAESPATGAQVDAILQTHGWKGCTRARPWAEFDADTAPDKLPYRIEGKQAVGNSPSFAAGVPGYVQFFVEVPPGAAGVELWFDVGSAFDLFGGFGGAASGGSGVALALQPGEPVTLSFDGPLTDLKTGVVQADPAKKGRSKITIVGPCLQKGKGKLYVMMLNQGNGSAGIQKMGKVFVDKAEGATNAWQCK